MAEAATIDALVFPRLYELSMVIKCVVAYRFGIHSLTQKIYSDYGYMYSEFGIKVNILVWA